MTIDRERCPSNRRSDLLCGGIAESTLEIHCSPAKEKCLAAVCADADRNAGGVYAYDNRISDRLFYKRHVFFLVRLFSSGTDPVCDYYNSGDDCHDTV